MQVSTIFRLAGQSLRRSPCLVRTKASAQQIRQFNSDFRVEGLSCAPVTPMLPNGDVNLDIYPAYVDHLLQMKIPNAFVLGTTGEGVSLNLLERKAVAEAWLKAGKGKLASVMVHIGSNSIKDCQELASHAASLGADAIACMSPVYFKPQTEVELVAFMKEVAAAAPNTPFYLYDINFMTGVYLNMPRFLDLASSAIPSLRGLKHSSPQLDSILTCFKHSDGKFDIQLGSDEYYLYTLALGLETPIPNSFLGPICHRMREAYKSGDLETAKEEQWKAQQVANIRKRYGGGFPQSKAILSMLGLDAGPCRLPLVLPPKDQLELLRKDLQDVGFFDWIKT